MLIKERDRPEGFEVGSADCLVHMAGSGIPPGATAVVGRVPSPKLVDPMRHQFRLSCPWALPLAPKNAAQFAPHPAVEFLEDALCLSEPEVSYPATQDRGEGFDGAPDGSPASLSERGTELVA